MKKEVKINKDGSYSLVGLNKEEKNSLESARRELIESHDTGYTRETPVHILDENIQYLEDEEGLFFSVIS